MITALVAEERQGARLFRGILHIGDFTETNETPVALGDDEVRKLRGTVDATQQPDGALIERTGDTPDGRGKVLELKRLHDLSDADSRRLQLGRNDLHGQLAVDLSEGLDVGNTGDRAQFARDPRIDETSELRRRQHRRRYGDGDDRTIGVIELADDRLLDLRWEIRANGRDGVAHVLRRLVEVLGVQELDHQHRVAVVRLADDAFYSGDRADLLLDGIQHFLLDDFRRRARIDDADREPWRRDVRELVGLQLHERKESEDHERDHGHDGDEWTLDGEI